MMNSSVRLGYGFLGVPAVPQMVALAQRAEELGYESAWVAETRFTRDGIAPVAAIAAGTRAIRVGTGIVNVFTRGPVVTAISFASLDEISGGRTLMGLGPGSPLILAPQGVPFDKPLVRLREYVQVIAALLEGHTVTFKGETIELQNVKLELEPVRRHIPLYLGVTGMKAMELAGELADGVLMNAFLPTSYTRRAIAAVAQGAARVGRKLTDLDLAGCLVVCVDDDGAHAKDQVRPLIALYLSVFPNIARETELPPEFVARVRAAFQAEGLGAAGPLISDQVVDQLVVAGTAAHCRARIEEYRSAGLALPVIFPLESNLEAAMEALAPHGRNMK
jgi:5,10-methylenetetrahydromethanopterin reductase